MSETRFTPPDALTFRIGQVQREIAVRRSVRLTMEPQNSYPERRGNIFMAEGGQEVGQPKLTPKETIIRVTPKTENRTIHLPDGREITAGQYESERREARERAETAWTNLGRPLSKAEEYERSMGYLPKGQPQSEKDRIAEIGTQLASLAPSFQREITRAATEGFPVEPGLATVPEKSRKKLLQKGRKIVQRRTEERLDSSIVVENRSGRPDDIDVTDINDESLLREIQAANLVGADADKIRDILVDTIRLNLAPDKEEERVLAIARITDKLNGLLDTRFEQSRLQEEQGRSFYLEAQDYKFLSADPIKWLDREFDKVLLFSRNGTPLDSPLLNEVQARVSAAASYLSRRESAIETPQGRAQLRAVLENFGENFTTSFNLIYARAMIDSRNVEQVLGVASRLKVHGIHSAMGFQEGEVERMFNRVTTMADQIRLQQGGMFEFLTPELASKIQQSIIDEQVMLASQGVGKYAFSSSDPASEQEARANIARAVRTGYDLYVVTQREGVVMARGRHLVGTEAYNSIPGEIYNVFNPEQMLVGRFDVNNAHAEEYQRQIKLFLARRHFREKLGFTQNEIEDLPEGRLESMGTRLLSIQIAPPDYFSSGWRMKHFDEQLEKIFVYTRENYEYVRGLLHEPSEPIRWEDESEIKFQERQVDYTNRKSSFEKTKTQRKDIFNRLLRHVEETLIDKEIQVNAKGEKIVVAIPDSRSEKNRKLHEQMQQAPEAFVIKGLEGISSQERNMLLNDPDSGFTKEYRKTILKEAGDNKNEFALFMQLQKAHNPSEKRDVWAKIAKYRSEEFVKLFRERIAREPRHEDPEWEKVRNDFRSKMDTDAFKWLDISSDREDKMIDPRDRGPWAMDHGKYERVKDAEGRLVDGEYQVAVKRFDRFRKLYDPVLHFIREEGMSKVPPEAINFAELDDPSKISPWLEGYKDKVKTILLSTPNLSEAEKARINTVDQFVQIAQMYKEMQGFAEAKKTSELHDHAYEHEVHHLNHLSDEKANMVKMRAVTKRYLTLDHDMEHAEQQLMRMEYERGSDKVSMLITDERFVDVDVRMIATDDMFLGKLETPSANSGMQRLSQTFSVESGNDPYARTWGDFKAGSDAMGAYIQHVTTDSYEDKTKAAVAFGDAIKNYGGHGAKAEAIRTLIEPQIKLSLVPMLWELLELKELPANIPVAEIQRIFSTHSKALLREEARHDIHVLTESLIASAGKLTPEEESLPDDQKAIIRQAKYNGAAHFEHQLMKDVNAEKGDLAQIQAIRFLLYLLALPLIEGASVVREAAK